MKKKSNVCTFLLLFKKLEFYFNLVKQRPVTVTNEKEQPEVTAAPVPPVKIKYVLILFCL